MVGDKCKVADIVKVLAEEGILVLGCGVAHFLPRLVGIMKSETAASL